MACRVEAAKLAAVYILLFLNLLMYVLLVLIPILHFNATIIAAQRACLTVGNMATGVSAICSLLAAVVGFIASVTGIKNVIPWTTSNSFAAAASALVTRSFAILALGLGNKENDLGCWTDSNLALETLMIILSVVLLLCVGIIHDSVQDVVARERIKREEEFK